MNIDIIISLFRELDKYLLHHCILISYNYDNRKQRRIANQTQQELVARTLTIRNQQQQQQSSSLLFSLSSSLLVTLSSLSLFSHCMPTPPPTTAPSGTINNNNNNYIYNSTLGMWMKGSQQYTLHYYSHRRNKKNKHNNTHNTNTNTNNTHIAPPPTIIRSNW